MPVRLKWRSLHCRRFCKIESEKSGGFKGSEILHYSLDLVYIALHSSLRRPIVFNASYLFLVEACLSRKGFKVF